MHGRFRREQCSQYLVEAAEEDEGCWWRRLPPSSFFGRSGQEPVRPESPSRDEGRSNSGYGTRGSSQIRSCWTARSGRRRPPSARQWGRDPLSCDVGSLANVDFSL